jgi:hypothetical protein
VAEDFGMRLAAAEFTFDDDHVEVPGEVETGDLVALHVGRSIGDEPGLQPCGADAVERGEGVFEELEAARLLLPVTVGDEVRPGVVPALRSQGDFDVVAARVMQASAPVFDGCLVLPELGHL